MSSSKLSFEMKFSKADEDAPQFVLKDNESYQDGQFSVQLSDFRGKVYCHLQSKNADFVYLQVISVINY